MSNHMKNMYRLLLISSCVISNIGYAAEFAATVDFAPRYQLSLPVSGLVKTLSVVTGQRVSKGDQLLKLDPAPFNTAKIYAQTRLTAKQTLTTESRRDLEQQQELYDRTVLAAVDLENAELREKRDHAMLKNAQAQLDDADYALSYSRLIAPFDALILSVHVNQGQSISNVMQSETLITLVRQGYYQAMFYVSADDLEKLSIGQKLTVGSQGKRYSGKISSIVYQPLETNSDDAHRYKIAATYAANDQFFPVGMKVSVHIDY